MRKAHQLSKEKKEAISSSIKEVLQKREEVLFVYLFGSFIEGGDFRDIDVGVYLMPESFEKLESSLDYTLDLAKEMGDITKEGIPFEARILNEAPLDLLNRVLSSGKLILCRDEEFLADLIEETSLRYMQYRPYAEQYIKERR